MTDQVSTFASLDEAWAAGKGEAEAVMHREPRKRWNEIRLSHLDLAEDARDLARGMRGNRDGRELEKRLARYHAAIADTLREELTAEEMGLQSFPRASDTEHYDEYPDSPKQYTLLGHKRRPLKEYVSKIGDVFPLITMVAVMAFGVFFGWPLWMAFILAGVGARVVAERRGAGRVTSRAYGIIPTLPMAFGWYWVPALAAIIHLWVWKHPGDAPPPEAKKDRTNGDKDKKEEGKPKGGKL